MEEFLEEFPFEDNISDDVINVSINEVPEYLLSRLFIPGKYKLLIRDEFIEDAKKVIAEFIIKTESAVLNHKIHESLDDLIWEVKEVLVDELIIQKLLRLNSNFEQLRYWGSDDTVNSVSCVLVRTFSKEVENILGEKFKNHPWK